MQSTEHEQDEALDTWMIEVDGVMVPDYDRTLTNFNEGDVVSGTVVRVDKDEILVDIGYKSEGVIPIAELSIRRSVNPDEEVALGDEIDALVLQKEDTEGRLDPVQEAGPLREGVEAHRGRRRERRAGRGRGHRGRQGRPHHRPGRARLPAGVAGRHPPRAGSRGVPRPDAALQGHRAQPQPQQRRAVAPRRARRGAQGAAPADPRPAVAGRRGSRASSRTSSTSARSSISTASTD